MKPGVEPAAARLRRLAPLLAAALLLPTLVLRSSWPPDELRYAELARNLARGDSRIVPSLNGEPYAEKPPVFFWLAAGAGALALPTDRAPRVVSVAAGIASVALVPLLGAALGLPAVVGARGALVLATTPLFLVHAQMGMLDALLTLLVALAALAKLRRHGRRGAPRLAWIALEGVALGAALLTKGPVALLFAFGLRLGAAAGRPAGPARFDRSDLAALATAAGLAGAWLATAAVAAGPAFVRAIALDQILGRLGGDVPHPAPLGELLAVGFAWLLPWSLVGLASARPRNRPRLPDGLSPLVGWLALPWLVLSVLPSQQVQYLLPGLPAGALLVGAALGQPPTRGVAAALALGGALLGATLVALGAFAGVVLPPDAFAAQIRADLVGDAWLRAGLASAGLLLLALVLARARPLQGRAAAAAATVFLAALLVTWRADSAISGAPILGHPHVASAPRVLAPSALRSAVRLRTDHPVVDPLRKEALLDEAARDPELVALVWEKHLGRLQAGAREAFEPVARGHVMGRPLIALRLRDGSAVRRRAPRRRQGRFRRASRRSERRTFPASSRRGRATNSKLRGTL